MGVDRNIYCIYGVELNKKDSEFVGNNFDKLEPYICGAPSAKGFTIIYDGMCGEHHYFGFSLGVLGEDITHIKLETQKEIDIRSVYKEIFGKTLSEAYEEKVGFYVINHYS